MYPDEARLKALEIAMTGTDNRGSELIQMAAPIADFLIEGAVPKDGNAPEQDIPEGLSQTVSGEKNGLPEFPLP